MRLRLALISLAMLMPLSTVRATEPVQFDYMMNCQGCHLADGAGFPARSVPAIKNHMGKFLLVEGGREFLIQVPGSAQSDLDNARLTAVVNWMLETFSANALPEDFEPYTEQEVAGLRVAPLVDVKGTRATLMRKIALIDTAIGTTTGSTP